MDTAARLAAKHARARDGARKLVAGGTPRLEAARIIGYCVDFVNRACTGLPAQYRLRAGVRNEHVPLDDECNVHGFWVPTPEQIAEEARKIRSGEVQIRAPRSAEERADRMDRQSA